MGDEVEGEVDGVVDAFLKRGEFELRGAEEGQAVLERLLELGR